MVSLPINLANYIKKENPFFLAPMAGVTDHPFRCFMKEMGCGIITTELISVRALENHNNKTQQLMKYDKIQRPLGIQIFGEDPEKFKTAVQKLEEEYQPDFIDLNLGCPVNKIVKKGAGSALLKDLSSLSKILNTMRKNCSLPLSLKIRTGWDEKNLNADQVAHLAYNEGFSWMTIHGRTRAQAYSGKADWNYIKKIKKTAPLPIIGNGDITSALKAQEALKFSQCDGIMIGRGCLNNPWIFLESLNKLQKKDVKINKDYLSIILKLKVHLENFYDERVFLLQMKKFAAWFSAGFPDSTEFRKNLFLEKDSKQVIQKIEDYFINYKDFEKKEPEYEPFLMQGHG